MPSRIETLSKPASIQLEIRHQIPGRIRLHVPALRDDPLLSRYLTQALIQIEGVRGVRWNPACASLVVRHRRSGPLTQEELDQVLQPVLQRAAWGRSAQHAARGAASTTVARRFPSSKGARRLVTRVPIKRLNWRSWLSLPESWRLPHPRRALGRPVKPPCRLCQLKLAVARWVFGDVWRCWTNTLTTPPRPQSR